MTLPESQGFKPQSAIVGVIQSALLFGKNVKSTHWSWDDQEVVLKNGKTRRERSALTQEERQAKAAKAEARNKRKFDMPF